MNPEMLKVLAEARYRNLWCADLITNVGSGASLTALLVLVAESRGSAGLSLFLLLTSVITLLFSTVAGAVADAHDRRSIVVTADVSRAVLTCGYLLIDPSHAFVVLLVLTMTRNAAGSFAGSANAAMIPALVPDDQLASAFSLRFLTSNGARVAGMGIAGLLLGAHQINLVWAIDAISYIVAAGFRWRVGAQKPAASEASDAASSTWLPATLARDSLTGLRHSLVTTDVRRMIIVVTVAQLASAAINVLVTPYVVRDLAEPAWWLSIIEAAGMTGLLLAAPLPAKLIRRFGGITSIGLGLGLASLGIGLIGAIPNVLWLLAMDPVTGSGVAIIQSASPTVVARATPDSLRGRAEANLDMAGSASYLIALPLIGLTAQCTSTRITFALCALPAASYALWLLTTRRPNQPELPPVDLAQGKTML